jgi:predicted O-methyltransferase YrrM
MMRTLARKLAGAVAPNWLAAYQARVTLARQAVELRDRCARVESFSDLAEEMTRRRLIYSEQKPMELAQLLVLVSQLRPAVVCEIGTAAGGNLLLFGRCADSAALIISIDLGYSPSQLSAYPHLAQAGQRMVCLCADSHDPRTVARVNRLLGSRPIDFLFIDGDHSLQGVRRDYEFFAPLVRPGGLVALHDIVPDSRLRTGIPSGANVGEVPLFWAELKAKSGDWQEIVDDPEQDGYGIGVVHLAR